MSSIPRWLLRSSAGMLAVVAGLVAFTAAAGFVGSIVASALTPNAPTTAQPSLAVVTDGAVEMAEDPVAALAEPTGCAVSTPA